MRFRVVFDQCMPDSLADDFGRCEVVLARTLGWERKVNGELLSAVEAAGHDALITTDKGFEHQQNLSGRKIGVVLLSVHPSTPARLSQLVPRAQEALSQGVAGQVVVITMDPGTVLPEA